MRSALLLSLALAGAQPLTHDLRMHDINYDGVTFKVSGWVNERGNIVWDQNDPANRLAWDSAKKNKPQQVPARNPLNYGLDVSRLSHTPAYSAHGAEANEFVQEIVRRTPMVEAKDSAYHVTVIGTPDERAKVVNDIKTHKAFDGLRDRLLVQDYAPGEWAVDPKLGFKTDGRPSIYVQTSANRGDPRGGRVVYRTRDYSLGPEGLASAIRKADPHYNPDIDPGINPFSIPQSWLIAGAVVIGAAVLLPKKG